MSKRHEDSMLLKASPTTGAKSLLKDLLRGRGTTTAPPSQRLSPRWAEKYFPSTLQKPSEQSSNGIQNASAGKEEGLTAYYLAEYLQSQGPRKQHDAMPAFKVQRICEGIWGRIWHVSFGLRDCIWTPRIVPVSFLQFFKEEDLLAGPRKVGQKTSCYTNLRRWWENLQPISGFLIYQRVQRRTSMVDLIWRNTEKRGEIVGMWTKGKTIGRHGNSLWGCSQWCGGPGWNYTNLKTAQSYE